MSDIEQFQAIIIGLTVWVIYRELTFHDLKRKVDDNCHDWEMTGFPRYRFQNFVYKCRRCGIKKKERADV